MVEGDCAIAHANLNGATPQKPFNQNKLRPFTIYGLLYNILTLYNMYACLSPAYERFARVGVGESSISEGGGGRRGEREHTQRGGKYQHKTQ